MKKKLLIMSLLLFSAFAVSVLNTACEADPEEACEQDLFCDDTMEVTACCTDGQDCYYTYDGVDYPDTAEGLAALVAALDCAKSKSVSVDGESELAIQLQALLEEARIRSKQ